MNEKETSIIIKDAGDYSGGSPVANGYSRHLITEDDGSSFVVKDFAIGVGDSFEKYSNEGMDELIIVVSGQVDFAISGEELQTLDVGTTVSIPSGKEFDLVGTTKKHCLEVYLSQSRVAKEMDLSEISVVHREFSVPKDLNRGALFTVSYEDMIDDLIYQFGQNYQTVFEKGREETKGVLRNTHFQETFWNYHSVILYNLFSTLWNIEKVLKDPHAHLFKRKDILSYVSLETLMNTANSDVPGYKKYAQTIIFPWEKGYKTRILRGQVLEARGLLFEEKAQALISKVVKEIQNNISSKGGNSPDHETEESVLDKALEIVFGKPNSVPTI